jgi:hypothetical protein
MSYATPGVYIDESNAFPNTVVQVATAIPIFIGYTEKAACNGKSVLGKPTRISSFGEFVKFFGGAFHTYFSLRQAKEPGENSSPGFIVSPEQQFRLYFYNSIRLFYLNGGSGCYILSAATYGDQKSQLANSNNFMSRKEHFLGGEIDGSVFPNVFEIIKQEFEPTLIVLPDVAGFESAADAYDVYVQTLTHCNSVQSRFAIFDVIPVPGKTTSENISLFREKIGTNFLNYGAAYYPWLHTTIVQDDEADFTVFTGDPGNLAPLSSIVISEVRKQLNILPPCGAIAGIYTSVDNTRGVWKAPANVSVAGALAPCILISDKEQNDMDLDAITGKSINAIKHIKGVGAMVWSARTLDGNSEDWRYINVRRTLIMIEQSIKMACRSFVFEPNNSSTWATINSMICNFLFNLWKQGALAGTAPERAYVVQIGLGTTMTPTDILDGMMHISVKVAIERPAEFILISFGQQQQQS